MPLGEAEFSELPVQVGHWTHPAGETGCTVILCPPGTVASGEVRGAAPATRETDLLAPGGLVQQAQAVLLSGGSAFGLAAADGVMRYLREQGIGYGTGTGAVPVPIVPAAAIYDRGAAGGTAPDSDAGYAACQAAVQAAGPLPQGRIGAGAGATVGKVAGPERSSPGGLGHAAVRVGDLLVGALMVVNAIGEVRDPASGQIVAGVRADDRPGFVPALDLLVAQAEMRGRPAPPSTPNTVIGVIVTNAPLDQTELAVVARMGNAGLARTITPAHTMFDGDTLFALAVPLPGEPSRPSPRSPVRVSLVGALAAEAVSRAILHAVRFGER